MLTRTEKKRGFANENKTIKLMITMGGGRPAVGNMDKRKARIGDRRFWVLVTRTAEKRAFDEKNRRQESNNSKDRGKESCWYRVQERECCWFQEE